MEMTDAGFSQSASSILNSYLAGGEVDNQPDRTYYSQDAQWLLVSGTAGRHYSLTTGNRALSTFRQHEA